ncbi:MAG: UDP-N-acetylmuramoyl-L-alanyl-D-glutamate--2,6-diaminopimelate ligase [Terriglobales bacterium]
MRFQQLLDGAEFLLQRGNPEILGLDYDSRRVQPGWCFVAMKGETTDGNRYIDAALQAGAVAVVSDDAKIEPKGEIAWAQVPHGRRALARLSANFYKRPAERLANSGITGTNGKTTTSFLLESILQSAGRKTALIGTVEYHVAGRVLPAPHTTPEPLETNRFLAEALRDGATESVMEVSSHALVQQRVFGIPYDVAIFTNLTRDHLDYHKDFADYFDAKRGLFEGVGTDPPRVAVVNAEDEYGQKLIKFSKSRSQVLTYGVHKADFHADKIDVGMNGARFDLVTPTTTVPLWSPLIGRVNVYNILAASAAAYARNCSPEAIAAGVERLTRVPGRFERVDAGQPFTVVVDYAHTDDALRNLTALAREFVSCRCPCHSGAKIMHPVACCQPKPPNTRGSTGRVITVFGCGGDRDRAKRPLMGEAAGRGSDYVILSSDNPRSEDPMAIINDALPGLQRSGVKYEVEPDRAKAIARAVRLAGAGDIVLLAGKGHEKTQTTREGVRSFDDVEVAGAALNAAGYHKQPVVAGGAR